jgi:cation transporter-like permease
MSKSDSLKEEIGLLKLFLGALIIIDVSLIAWVAQNYARATRVLVVTAVIAGLLATAASSWITHLVYRRIERLEDA